MTNLVLQVEGMSCNHCVEAVTKALKAVQGVDSVDVSLAEKKVSIGYEDASVTPEQLKEAIEDQGYDVV
jgi:copper chaperone